MSQLNEAELRLEARKLYKHLGYPGILQVLYEILKGAEIMAEVFAEELKSEEKS